MAVTNSYGTKVGVYQAKLRGWCGCRARGCSRGGVAGTGWVGASIATISELAAKVSPKEASGSVG
jgi:hypothetical protein